MGLFGSSKKQAAPAVRKGPPPMSLENASKHMDSKVKAIDVKVQECQKELEKYRLEMKKPGGHLNQGLKTRALNMLRRKKMYESQRDQLMNTQFNVDQAAFNTDNMQVTMQTVDAMKSAAATMKTQVAKLDIDDIEEMQDDMIEVNEDMNDIMETMGRAYGVPADFDEAELNAEFEAMAELDELEMADNAGPSYLSDIAEVPSAPLQAAPVATSSGAQQVPAGLPDEFK